MTDKLNWGYDKHDFSSIKETLIKFYPIEKHHQYNEDSIRDFKGVKEIEEILNDNFFTTKIYKERWGKFKKFLKEELKKPIHESIIAFYPCYSGIVVLKKEKNKNLTYTKELHFFISLLGSYYTIFGIDKCEIILQEMIPTLNGGEELLNLSYDANLVITVSPYLEFQEPFQELQKKIIKYFPSLKFIPYNINLEKAEGVSLLYPDSQAEVKDSVFSALFRPENYFNSETRGDPHFGFDEWLIIKKLDNGRIEGMKKGLFEKSLKTESILTVNKVWKFKACNPIPGKSEMGNLSFFGMDSFRILDLTDQEFLTIISNEDEEPVVSRYSIVDNEIRMDHFQNKIGLRISGLGNKELKLILHANIIFGEKIIKGDIFEMTYESYK